MVSRLATRSVIPFGPQHPVLPEPIHLDLVVEDEKVIEAIPQIGYVHRGLEKLTQKRDFKPVRLHRRAHLRHLQPRSRLRIRERHREAPQHRGASPRGLLRDILEELSRIHSHLLWLGLLADAFGFEALFNHCWRLRENILDIFQRTCGGRIILSILIVGGLAHDIEDSELHAICEKLDSMRAEYQVILDTMMNDLSVKSRLCGVGTISYEEATELSMVGPFAKGSGVEHDMRSTGYGAYGDLDHFAPIISNECDCYARCKVRAEEVLQSMDIIKELVAKIPHDGIGGKPKAKVVPEGQSHVLIEQPRGEAFLLRARQRHQVPRPLPPAHAHLAEPGRPCQGAPGRGPRGCPDDHPYDRPVHLLHGKVGRHGNFQTGKDDAALAVL